MAYKKYIVKQGDCISSIAFENDLFPDTIWNHPDNAELKRKRKDPNALYPGDEVIIPGKELKEESCSAEQKHCFRRKGVPEKLRIQFLDEDQDPRGGIPYILEIKTKSGDPFPLIEGETDNDGYLEEAIPPDAHTGELTLGEGADEEVIEIMLGHLDPIDTISGIKARLNNMGYECGEEDDELDEMARNAIREFQEVNNLDLLDDTDTDIDKATQDKIEEMYSN